MSEITLASRILSTGLVRPWPPVQRPRHRHRETDRLEARIGRLEDELRRCRMLAAQTERLGRIGSWVLDLDGGALAWSEGTYHIFGLTPGQPVTLEQATGFYSGPVQARLGTVVEEAIASGQPYDITLQHTTADNTERWVTLDRADRDRRRRRPAPERHGARCHQRVPCRGPAPPSGQS